MKFGDGVKNYTAKVRDATKTGLVCGFMGEEDSEQATIAKKHEYGIGVPQRDFMATTLRRYGKKLSNLMKRSLRAQIKEGSLLPYRRAGVVFVGYMQATVRDGPWQPNSKETIKRKKSSRPLIDTGQMIQSIRAAVTRPGTREIIG